MKFTMTGLPIARADASQPALTPHGGAVSVRKGHLTLRRGAPGLGMRRPAEGHAGALASSPYVLRPAYSVNATGARGTAGHFPNRCEAPGPDWSRSHRERS